ncbi:YegP family protein [Serratia oryzae]|uniref:YegP family protein n=1 Tax=Serratia oryzae TaxID=2034155 RepID=UPI0012E1E2D4|nr:YegP family protein [Serratia oryzae]
MATGHYELKKSSNGQYHFTLKASNGEIILSSERYASKASAENGIASVRANAPHEAQFELKLSNSNKPYFVLRAKNHVVIGTSQMYASENAAKNGVLSVIKHGATPHVRDLNA